MVIGLQKNKKGKGKKNNTGGNGYVIDESSDKEYVVVGNKTYEVNYIKGTSNGNTFATLITGEVYEGQDGTWKANLVEDANGPVNPKTGKHKFKRTKMLSIPIDEDDEEFDAWLSEIQRTRLVALGRENELEEDEDETER